MTHESSGAPLSLRQRARERANWLVTNILPHESWVRSHLRSSSFQGCDIDDVVQESYARLIMLDSVAHIVDPRGYVLRIAKNVLLQHVRHSKVVPIELVEHLDTLQRAADDPLPDQHAEGRQQWRLFQDAIASLPPRCQQVYRLRKIEGLSQREVAQRLMMSESNVEKHLGRGVEKLMAILGRGQNRIPSLHTVRRKEMERHAGSQQ